MTKEEEILTEVLNYIKRPSIPELWDEKSIWFKALAETLKVDGSKGYAVLKNVNGYDYNVVKDFGHPAKINKILSIRPYIMLQNRHMLKFSNKTDIIEYMVKKFGEDNRERITNMSNLELKKLCYADAIDTQTESVDDYTDFFKNKYMPSKDIVEESKDKENESEEESIAKYEELDEEKKERIEKLNKMQNKAKNGKRGRKKTKVED